MESEGLMGTKPVIEPVYLCVYIPEFPAQALLRHRPALAATPAVVLSGNPPLESVISINLSAQRLGITHGITRSELEAFSAQAAFSAAEAQPPITILHRSLPEERSARAALLELAGIFTPRVEVQPVSGSAFAMVLDMTGTLRIFGPIAQAARTLAARLQSLQFTARLAASANLHAAVSLAQVSLAPSARTAPAIIPRGQEAACLAPLPLSALALTPQQSETLALWGLNTLGELAQIPEVELIIRLGQPGKRLRLLARGEHPHLMVPEEPAFTLEEFLELEAPVEILDSLLFAIGPMLDQLLLRAQNRSYALASVTLTISLESDSSGAGGNGDAVGAASPIPTHTRTIKPALPVAQREVLLKLLHLDLDAHPPPAAVTAIFIQAEPGDRSKVQLGLFSPQLPEPSRLDVTLARIAALVGEERVGRARLLDTHKPEAFLMERFVVPTSAPPPNPSTNSIAARRCRPPVPLRISTVDRRPVSFYLQDRLYQVTHAYGPWRRSGDWWSSSVWSHEEWDAQATSGSDTLLCLISHDLLHHRWQLEALYD